MTEIINALKKAGLKVEQRDQHTLVVSHSWREPGGGLKKSLAANQKATRIAKKYNPKSIEAVNQFSATVIKF